MDEHLAGLAPPRSAALILIAPIAEVATSPLVFRFAERRLGRWGYLAGFIWYWSVWGVGFPLTAIGWRRLWHRLSSPARVGRWPWTAHLLMGLLPPSAAMASEAIPRHRQTTPAEMATSIGVACVNATAEELMWRAVYLDSFPGNAWLALIYPTVLFGLSHLGPQSIRPSRRGVAQFTAAAGALGAIWGWIGYDTSSLRLTLLSHIATDACGLSSAKVFLGRAEPRRGGPEGA